MKAYLFFSIIIFLTICPPVFSQDSETPKYVSIAYMRSASPDFVQSELEFWQPIHQELIKEGKKMAWYLYKVKYPGGENANYDYVRFNIFSNWDQIESPYEGLDEVIKKVHPEIDVETIKMSTENSRIIVYEQLYEVIDQAANKVSDPAKYINTNEVRSVAGETSEYANMEVSYFKPFHQERVKRKLMNNWQFYRLYMPYGEKFDIDYVTLNGFNTWAEITASNPSDLWSSVHGELEFNKVHDKILSKRKTINNEIWELVTFAAK